jgi:hypothetical protein
MGYDMHMASPSETFIDALDRATALARLELTEAIEAQNALEESGQTQSSAVMQKTTNAVVAAQEKLQNVPSNYFRLNIGGMSLACQLMLDFDMTYPSYPDGVYPYPANEDYDPDTDSDPEYEAAIKQFLTSGVRDRPGIALHKFGSNDGWHITELECLGAVAQWRAWCDSQGLPYDHKPVHSGHEIEWWTEWVDWLEASGFQGGVVIY